MGYILTGTIVSYLFDFNGTNIDTLELIAEFGVVFLMFTIGLELNFSKMKTMKDILQKAIQKESKKSISHSIKLKEEISKELSEIAESNGISFNRLVSNILEEVLKSSDTPTKTIKDNTKNNDFEILEKITNYIQVKMKNDNSIKYYRVLENGEYREVKEGTYKKQKNKIK